MNYKLIGKIISIVQNSTHINKNLKSLIFKIAIFIDTLHFSPKKIHLQESYIIRILNHDLIEGNLFWSKVSRFLLRRTPRASLSYLLICDFDIRKKRYLYNKSNDKRDYEKFIKNPMKHKQTESNLNKLCKEYNYKIIDTSILSVEQSATIIVNDIVRSYHNG